MSAGHSALEFRANAASKLMSRCSIFKCCVPLNIEIDSFVKHFVCLFSLLAVEALPADHFERSSELQKRHLQRRLQRAQQSRHRIGRRELEGLKLLFRGK